MMNHEIRHRDGCRPIVNRHATPVIRMISIVWTRPEARRQQRIHDNEMIAFWRCFKWKIAPTTYRHV